MQALEDIKVIDLSVLLPGNYCGMLLADFGAEVVKVEPSGGDPVRGFLPQKEGLSYWHIMLNRNKKSVALDLKTEAGRAGLLNMVKEADVLLEAFRPGAMDKLGLSYATLSGINPRLIYCSLSGYGDYSAKAAHDLNISGLVGVNVGDGAPLVGDAQFSGIMAANQAALGILAALHARTLSGKGQKVDVSLLRSAISMLPVAASNCLGELETGTPVYPRKTPNYTVYPTKDDKYMTVGMLEERFWRRLCEVLGLPDLADKMGGREEFPAMFARLEEVFRQKTRAEWEEIFAGEDICVTPVLDIKEAIERGILDECGMLTDVEDEQLGRYRQFGLPVVLSDTPGRLCRRAPYLGEHNGECGVFANDICNK